MNEWDVVVVGAGNAALCAAVAAAQEGSRVLVLERAPRGRHGGNSAFTAGAMRIAYSGAADIRSLIPDLSEEELSTVDFGAYPASEFRRDLDSVTNHRTDPELADVLVGRSLETLQWMRRSGVRFAPLYDRQTFEVDGLRRFWGGLTVGTAGAGPGLVESLLAAASRLGVDVWFETRAVDLLRVDGTIRGVRAECHGKPREIVAASVVLACGGYEANTEMRTRYMGPGWDTVKVRGTVFNQGDGIRMALEAGAMSWGQYSGGHAVFWDRDAPDFGNLEVSNMYSKLSYPFGIVVNSRGERFIDEGADFRNYTYAKYGKELVAQPGGFAWQVFDAKAASLLSVDYHTDQVTKVTADSLEALAPKMAGVDAQRFAEVVDEYNHAVDRASRFDPTTKDGVATKGLHPPKSNWALPIDEPPFEAYAVTCGLTFTFGGLRIAPDRAQVLDTEENPIKGLYAAGELVGGLFYDNYPGGSGLTAGSVFGRIAGVAAAREAKEMVEAESS